MKTTLIVFGGFAGVGKSTMARELSRRYNFPLFSSDDYVAALQSSLAKEFHEVSPTAFDVIWHIAQTHLANGVSVLLDANMCHARSWESLDRVVAACPGVQCLPIILQCSLETHRARVEHRGATEPEHFNLGGDSFEKVLHKYDYIMALQREDIVRVDAERPRETVLEEVLGLLRDRVGLNG